MVQSTNHMKLHETVVFASIGSVIETTFSDGTKTQAKITTTDQCCLANELILTGRWYVVYAEPTKEKNK